MKKLVVLLFIVVGSMVHVQAENYFGKQLINNFHVGWDVNRTDNYRWRNFNIGTGYGNKFGNDPRASWQLSVDFNWSKYTLYSDGDFAIGNSDALLRTKSLSFPLVVSYEVYKSFFNGIKVYTGPVYEVILSSTLDKVPFYDYRPSQWGWTVGTRIRFLIIFSARIAYNFYPTALLYNGEMNRSAVSFSLGF